MGRKYLGKHNGKTREPYEKALLCYEPKNHKETLRLDRQVTDYLGEIGYQMLATFSEDAWDNHMYRAFHVAGTTIGVSSKFKNRQPSARLPKDSINALMSRKPYVQLQCCSNQGLDDVVKKIKDKFPVFIQEYKNPRP